MIRVRFGHLRQGIGERCYYWAPNMTEFDTGQFVLDCSHNRIYIHSVCINNINNQGKGYGQRMMKEAITLAKRISKTKPIILDVLCNNEVALHVYKKCGFEITGKWKSCYGPAFTMTYTGT